MSNHGHVGVFEVAALLGVTRQRVHALRVTYPDFPQPVASIRAGLIWHTTDIERWRHKHPDRPTGRPATSRTPQP